MRLSTLATAALALAGLIVLLSRRDLNEPHLRVFTDMLRTPAYHSQAENPIFKDRKTLQTPPAGTISRDFHPFPYGPDAEERARAGRELKNPFEPSYEVLTRGKFVFDNYCSHCHGRKGLGDGAVAKAFPSFSFPLATKSTLDLPDGVLFHVITYGRNLMPPAASQLSQADRWKVIHYLRDLQRQEIARLGPAALVPEDPRRRSLISDAYGKELFVANCASCHGDEGLKPKPGIPTLHLPAVLAIADDAYYRDIITHGRPGTQMPAWGEILTKTQIQSLVVHIRSWASAAPSRPKTAVAVTGAEKGAAIYATHCIGCHGKDGGGGIGNSLNSASFLSLASDQLLRDTIGLGRHHTAMPASYDLRPEDVDALIAYIRGWTGPGASYEAFAKARTAASPAAGKALFAKSCAGCHGEKGEGAEGSRLNSDGFLSMADDRLLYQVIVNGRRQAGMPAWRDLQAKEVADLVAFLRTWQKSPAVELSSAPHRGRAEFGEVLYRANCVKCHGPQGEGLLGTEIANPELLSQVSDDFLWRTIAYGKAETEMKGFLKRDRDPLASEDIDHIIAFLRRQQKNPPAEGLRRRYDWASAKDGQKVYEVKGGCIKCHGPLGEGASGPALGNPVFLRAASDPFLAGMIVLGRGGTPMKSYYNGADTPRLEEEDVENVIAYIRTFEKDSNPDNRRVEGGHERVALGRSLFKENCAKCHGDQGQGKHEDREGGYAPSLNNPEFLKAANDNFLLATIALGRPGTPMRAFGDGMAGKAGLTADQIRAIVAYLRSWEKKK